jgi:Flp pilus assembly protein TadB
VTDCRNRGPGAKRRHTHEHQRPPSRAVGGQGRSAPSRRLDTNETSIVDFKPSDERRPKGITRDQLHAQAVLTRLLALLLPLWMYLTVGALIILALLLAAGFWAQQRRDARHHRVTRQSPRWTMAPEDFHT